MFDAKRLLCCIFMPAADRGVAWRSRRSVHSGCPWQDSKAYGTGRTRPHATRPDAVDKLSSTSKGGARPATPGVLVQRVVGEDRAGYPSLESYLKVHFQHRLVSWQYVIPTLNLSHCVWRAVWRLAWVNCFPSCRGICWPCTWLCSSSWRVILKRIKKSPHTVVVQGETTTPFAW